MMEAEPATAVARPSTDAPACVICGTALAGPLGALFRLVGINRSARNPNLCNRCNTHVEEGRVVELTVLFADLSGFTAMTRKLGPERTHAVVDAFLKAATYALVRHGAFIDKYVGDAVMAFFNAPIRYEDHAARAVAAARDRGRDAALAEQFGVDLQAAIGIASGYAHVGRLGSGEEGLHRHRRRGEPGSPPRGPGEGGEVVVDEAGLPPGGGPVPRAVPEQVDLKGFGEPVAAYRFGTAESAAARDAPRHAGSASGSRVAA